MSAMFKRRQPKLVHTPECEFIKQEIIALKIRINAKRDMIRQLKAMQRNTLLQQLRRDQRHRHYMTLRGERQTIKRLEDALVHLKHRYHAVFDRIYQASI